MFLVKYFYIYNYTLLDPKILEYNYRYKNILQETLMYEPDVICLQEVDNYGNIFLSEYSKRGYEGVYKQRTGGKTDGCAIFFKRDKYYLIGKLEIEFNNLALNQDGKDKIRYNTNNVSLLIHLESLATGEPILMCNTHIWWDSGCADVQLAQAKYLIQCIEQFKDSQGIDPSIILCGDFNSVPKSPVYNCIITSVFGKYMFNSSYKYHSNSAQYNYEAPFTVYGKGVKKAIDYIFYCGRLEVGAILELPSEDAIISIIGKDGIPSQTFSSDHFCLYTQFFIVPT